MVDQVHRRSAQGYSQRQRRNALLVWAAGSAASFALGLVVFAEKVPYVLFAALLLLGVIPVLRPRHGLYLFFLAMLLIEQVEPPGGPGLISAKLPFFGNINAFTPLPIPASPAELTLGLIAVGCVLPRFRRGITTRVSGNPLLLPIALLALTFILGTAYGLATGGDFKAALWEIRAPFYMLLLIVLVPLLVEDRGQVKTLIWIAIAGGVLKALEGLWVSAVVLHFATNKVDTVVGHDDAVFLAADLVLLGAMLLVDGERWQRMALGVSAPLLLYVLFVTNRRAAFVALIIGLLIVGAARFKERPVTALRVATILVVVGGLYGATLGVTGVGGALAQPIRAITSAYSPSSDRDEASNVYRAYERTGLWITIKAHPVVGIGFGKRYDVTTDVFDIGFPLYEYIPHNDILRVWAKAGTVGFVALWLFFGAVMVQGLIVYRRLRDEKLKALTIFGVAFAGMQITVQYVDMLMTFYRNMAFLGLVVGLFLCFEKLERAEVTT